MGNFVTHVQGSKLFLRHHADHLRDPDIGSGAGSGAAANDRCCRKRLENVAEPVILLILCITVLEAAIMGRRRGDQASFFYEFSAR